MDTWARLSLYESTDLVRGLFQSRHGRELNAEKAREIVSAFAQGREYFSAASEAGLLVRPLLQYYGVLSLSRALVLLLSPVLREAALPQAHGLSATNWGALLAANTWRPADLQVRFSRGSLLSLLEATQNADVTTLYTGPYPSRLTFTNGWPVPQDSTQPITFQQLLSRISELRLVYERSFGVVASTYRAFAFTLSVKTHTDVDVFNGEHGLPPEDQLRQELGIPEATQLQQTFSHNFLPQEPHLWYRIEHPEGTTYTKSLPKIENLSDGSMSIVAPFPGGLQLSRLGRFYLLAYYLGTLARYHPTSWLAVMQSRQRGDFLLPIIREAMAVIQSQYPDLIMSEIEA